VNLRRILVKTKYILLGLFHFEFPPRSILKIAESAIEFIEPNVIMKGNVTPSICWLSWKSKYLGKTHWLEWKKYINKNPEIKFFFFDDKLELNWMENHYKGTRLLGIYKDLKFGAQRSDIFRLCLLKKYGGLFLSINRMINLDLIKTFPSNEQFIISFEKIETTRYNPSLKIPELFRNKKVVQWGLMSGPNHAFVNLCLKTIEGHAESFRGIKFPNVAEPGLRFSGPDLLSSALDSYLEKQTNGITYMGFDYNNSMIVPNGSKYRYAWEPSYLTYKNQSLLD